MIKETETKEKSPKQVAYEQQQEELALYERRVEKMSHRQLVSELNRGSNQGYVGKGFTMNGLDFSELNVGKKIRNRAGLTNGLATVLKTVLENTKTAPVFDFDKKGNPSRYARPDQIGPGALPHYLS